MSTRRHHHDGRLGRALFIAATALAAAVAIGEDGRMGTSKTSGEIVREGEKENKPPRKSIREFWTGSPRCGMSSRTPAGVHGIDGLQGVQEVD
jgi:hypothetical protein